MKILSVNSNYLTHYAKNTSRALSSAPFRSMGQSADVVSFGKMDNKPEYTDLIYKDPNGIFGDPVWLNNGKVKGYVFTGKTEKGTLRFLVSPGTGKYPGTKISGNGVDISFKGAGKPVSFMGQLWGSIRNNGDIDNKMKQVYIDFFNKQGDGGLSMSKYVKQNYLSDAAPNDDYNFYIPSDGDGTRYYDITCLQSGKEHLFNSEVHEGKKSDVTKPASDLPAILNGMPIKFAQCVMMNYARTGKLEDNKPLGGFIEVEPAQGSAYAFLEGLASGQIPTDKPIVFSWGDNFSDIDIAKLMKFHEDKGNAGFTMLTLPVSKERITSLGAAQVDNSKNLQVTKFVEKPANGLDFVIPGLEKETENCLAVVGPYIMSPSVLKWIKQEYANDKLSFKDPKKGYDFSTQILQKLLAKMQSEGFQDENGKSLKMYAYRMPKEESWSDIGARKDFLDAMLAAAKPVGVEGAKFIRLPKEMRESIGNNVDENGNITFDAKAREAFNKFCADNNLEVKNAIVFLDAA